jgi:hypothetical protein
MAIVDGPQKTAFALAQAQAARALADAVPDQHAKRLTARGVFVAVAAFIEIARQTRTTITKTKANRADLEALKRALNVLADRDWGPYRPLRDRVGAHRQPIGGADDPASWGAANELFAQVDAPLIGVLCDDMTDINAELQRLSKRHAVNAAVLPADAVASIGAAPQFQRRRGLQVSTGSFGETVANSISPVQPATIGERLRQISDTIDGFECYAALARCIAGIPVFERAVVAGAIIETANIVELVFDVPAGRSADNLYAPLVALIPPHYVEGADLRAAATRIDSADIEWIRSLRNSSAAHIDAKLRIVDLINRLDTTNPSRIDAIFHQVTRALSDADQHDITVLSPLVRLRGAVLAGAHRLDGPAFSTNYDE